MTRSLADGHKKIAVLTVEPTDPMAPTVTELNAGIGGAAGAGSHILLSDWTHGPAASETFNDRAVSEKGNANAYGAENYQGGMTVFRRFDETGSVDVTADELFQAVKARGSRVWVYEREDGKEESEPWTAGDELWFGAEWLTDLPQRTDTAGYIKRRIDAQVQKGYPDAVVAAGV